MKDRMSKDEFWDIQKLIPKKSEKTERSISTKKPRLADVAVTSEPSSPIDSSFSFSSTVPKSTSKEPSSYSYQNLSPLVRFVKVTDWKNEYHYYEFFCKNAVFFQDKVGSQCERIPFFSYVPQYSQMSKEQLRWFLWWRQNVKNSVYIETDISYILLYFYECINLGELLDTRKTLADMIGVWNYYRKSYPQLDPLVSEWLCDYSLIHRISIEFPREDLSRDMIMRCSLREVYYTFDPHDFLLYAKFLLTYCNAYNYRKSKFYNEVNSSLYETHIPAALARLLETKREFFLDGHCHLHRATRTAFTGALCSYRMRKKIDVEYISLADTDQLKEIITSVIKYCENKIRASLLIRSRLGTGNIEPQLAAILDSYFDEVGISKGFDRYGSESSGYERLYDNPDTEFSLKKAMEIERSSWNMTERLVETFEENVSLETNSEFSANLEPEVNMTQETSPSLKFEQEIVPYAEFFKCVLQSDFSGQDRFCREHGLMADAIADRINEISADIFDDILLEERENGYIIIEEYKYLFES